MSKKSEAWWSYEEVAKDLLNRLAAEFGLSHVEGKQVLRGKSGTDWQLDAKGVNVDGKGVVVVECRRYNKAKLKQEQVAAVAYRIGDVGASGGIIVSPLPLQEGAAIVARYANIEVVQLNPGATNTEYVMKFLNRLFVGLSASVTFKSELQIDVIRDGKIVETRKVKD